MSPVLSVKSKVTISIVLVSILVKELFLTNDLKTILLSLENITPADRLSAPTIENLWLDNARMLKIWSYFQFLVFRLSFQMIKKTALVYGTM
jgi:hypothetical protein